MPPELIRAIGILKKAAALVNYDLGNAPKRESRIDRGGRRRGHCRKNSMTISPCAFWQTGSGTQPRPT